MKAQSFRLNSPTLGILLTNEGNKIPLTVPSGATVAISNGPLDGNRLVDVIWEGKQLMMFTQDLRDRARQVHSAEGENSANSS